VLYIYETYFKKDQPIIATTCNNIALINNKMCDYESALEYYGKALAIRENIYVKISTVYHKNL